MLISLFCFRLPGEVTLQIEKIQGDKNCLGKHSPNFSDITVKGICDFKLYYENRSTPARSMSFFFKR